MIQIKIAIRFIIQENRNFLKCAVYTHIQFNIYVTKKNLLQSIDTQNLENKKGKIRR